MIRLLTLLNLLVPLVLTTSCGVRTEPVPYISIPRETAPAPKAPVEPVKPTAPKAEAGKRP